MNESSNDSHSGHPGEYVADDLTKTIKAKWIQWYCNGKLKKMQWVIFAVNLYRACQAQNQVRKMVVEYVENLLFERILESALASCYPDIPMPV